MIPYMIDTWGDEPVSRETTFQLDRIVHETFIRPRPCRYVDVGNLMSWCNQSRMLCKFTSSELNKHVLVCGF